MVDEDEEDPNENKGRDVAGLLLVDSLGAPNEKGEVVVAGLLTVSLGANEKLDDDTGAAGFVTGSFGSNEKEDDEDNAGLLVDSLGANEVNDVKGAVVAGALNPLKDVEAEVVVAAAGVLNPPNEVLDPNLAETQKISLFF